MLRYGTYRAVRALVGLKRGAFSAPSRRNARSRSRLLARGIRGIATVTHRDCANLSASAHRGGDNFSRSTGTSFAVNQPPHRRPRISSARVCQWHVVVGSGVRFETRSSFSPSLQPVLAHGIACNFLLHSSLGINPHSFCSPGSPLQVAAHNVRFWGQNFGFLTRSSPRLGARAQSGRSSEIKVLEALTLS